MGKKIKYRESAYIKCQNYIYGLLWIYKNLKKVKGINASPKRLFLFSVMITLYKISNNIQKPVRWFSITEEIPGNMIHSYTYEHKITYRTEKKQVHKTETGKSRSYE